MIARAACRLRSPITVLPANYLRRFSLPFSSFPPPASHPQTRRTADDTGSAVYRDARRYARPSTVTWTERLHDSISLIGTVEFPLMKIATRNRFGVHTILRVKTSHDSDTSFLIFLCMWDDIAQRALQHLKPNDYIYVSGQLGAYTKADLNGIEKIRYKVTAKELNYVKQGEPEVKPLRIMTLGSEGQNPGQSLWQKQRSCLYLWQVFFVNPSEWYDQRKSKETPKHPDFKHKSTGEVLWLSDSDPPWVKKQLELLDSKLSEGARSPGIMRFPSSSL